MTAWSLASRADPWIPPLLGTSWLRYRMQQPSMELCHFYSGWQCHLQSVNSCCYLVGQSHKLSGSQEVRGWVTSSTTASDKRLRTGEATPSYGGLCQRARFGSILNQGGLCSRAKFVGLLWLEAEWQLGTEGHRFRVCESPVFRRASL